MPTKDFMLKKASQLMKLGKTKENNFCVIALEVKQDLESIDASYLY